MIATIASTSKGARRERRGLVGSDNPSRSMVLGDVERTEPVMDVYVEHGTGVIWSRMDFEGTSYPVTSDQERESGGGA